MKQLVLFIADLNCPTCGEKIIKRLEQLDFVQEVSINYVNNIIYISVSKDSETNRNIIIKNIKAVSDVEVSFKNKLVKEHNIKDILVKNINLLIGIGLLIISFVIFPNINNKTIVNGIYIIIYIIIAYKVLFKSIKNIFKGDIFDENFLMSVATIGALFINQYDEAIAVMLFYNIGELLEDFAVNKARSSISETLDLRSNIMHIYKDHKIIDINPNDVVVNDIMVINPGEKVAVDGIIIKGDSYFDTSSLTGENVAKHLGENDKILAGYINNNSVIEARVTTTNSESTASKILALVENGAKNKTHIEKFITKFAKIYTPVVITIALSLIIFPLLVTNHVSYNDIYQALTFLVIACPCALVISIPLGLFAGIGRASKEGIIIKGGNYLQALENVTNIVFDKTGTLTEGNFDIINIKGLEVDNNTLLKIASYGESFSNHPIAKSIIKHYGKTIDKSLVSNYQEIPGKGISFKLANETYYMGNYKLISEHHYQLQPINTYNTIIYVLNTKAVLGYIEVGDNIKKTSLATILGLKQLGINNIYMLSGDNQACGEAIAKQLQIPYGHFDLLPQNKVNEFAKIKKTHPGISVFVGDGMNDAPVLALADVGISMGGMGSDASINASDIVLMKDDPYGVIKAIKIAQKTRHILNQNLIIILGVKILLMLLIFTNHAAMWLGVFGDVGVCLITILNAIKILKYKIN